MSETFETKVEEYFRCIEQKCINELTHNTGQVISTGGGVPIHSTISEKSLIYIYADFDVIVNRLSAIERQIR